MSETLRLYLDVQQMVDCDTIPQPSTLKSWILTTLKEEARHSQKALDDEYELTVRIVAKGEIQQLNKTYRNKDMVTNVLSFPFEVPAQINLPLLGDLVICHDVVVEEALQQHKAINDHWAHMVVHGVLHLKGYDHINDADARIMEALEVHILKRLHIADPYH